MPETVDTTAANPTAGPSFDDWDASNEWLESLDPDTASDYVLDTADYPAAQRGKLRRMLGRASVGDRAVSRALYNAAKRVGGDDWPRELDRVTRELHEVGGHELPPQMGSEWAEIAAMEEVGKETEARALALAEGCAPIDADNEQTILCDLDEAQSVAVARRRIKPRKTQPGAYVNDPPAPPASPAAPKARPNPPRRKQLAPSLKGRRVRKRTYERLRDIPHEQLMLPAVPRPGISRAEWEAARKNVSAFKIWDGERAREEYRPYLLPGQPDWLPADLVYLADVSRISYLSDKYDSIPREWVHTFGSGSEPILAIDPRSGVLLILGWGEKYDVTAAGIVDAKQRRPREIPSLVSRPWPGEGR